MSYAKAELQLGIGEELGLTGDAQPLQAEDEKIIRRVLPGVLADLVQRRIVPAVDLDAIPDAVYGHLCVIVASEIADKFELSTEDRALLAGRAQGAESKLRNQRAVTVPSPPLRMSSI